ncbi:MAG: hypothetical protein COU25_03735 [Candidatus Levybacteria bacterium CG10_big_fil_rev_8_21_14_0_10_35_13]|nr:MAG: hypothetical protein COU25_03735 [Candidatus Levybacteria bacterium CG10_big_fil_rev_8_21_14_0_10_35_13]
MNEISRRDFVKFALASSALFALEKNMHFIDSVVDRILPEDNIIERARRELKENGITREQARGYSFLSPIIYKYIQPFNYDPEQQWFKIKYHSKLRDFTAMPGREAAWKMYLGIPLNEQERKFFEISETRPAKEKNPAKYYYCFPNKEEDILSAYNKFKDYGDVNVRQAAQIAYYEPQVLYCKTKDYMIIWDSTKDHIMGKFKVMKGKDDKGEYISYYDIWDLEPGGFSLSLLFGKPFEIYNRIYLKK